MIRIFGILFIVMGCLNLLGCKSNPELSDNSEGNVSDYKVNSKAATVNVQLGLGYLEGGNSERAKHKLLIALKQDPDSPTVNDAMAYYLESTGSIPEAETYYKKSISLAPNHGESLNNYGTFLCRQKQYEKADEYFLKAIQDTNYVKSAEAYENAGLCALKISNVTKAREYFDRALQQDPRRATSLFELADLDYKNNNFKQANIRLINYFMMREPDAESALLAYRVAKKLGDAANATNYSQLIRTKFSTSKEYQQLQTTEN